MKLRSGPEIQLNVVSTCPSCGSVFVPHNPLSRGMKLTEPRIAPEDLYVRPHTKQKPN